MSTWRLFLLLAGAMALATQCNPPKKSPATPGKPITPGAGKPTTPTNPPVDTVAWKPGQKPDQQPGRDKVDGPYRIALLLPFLTNQYSATVPEKSELALQFYAGARLAAQQLSTAGGPNLKIDVVDSQLSDAEFQSALTNPLLKDAQVIIGPARASHVGLLSAQAIARRQILISPMTPSSELVKGFPDFLQTSPSLRAHCEAIVRHVARKHDPAVVTLLCKQKESDRLPYFQQAQVKRGGAPFRELILPDNTADFSQVSLKSYIQPGKTSVFIVPSWASQDFINSLLRKLKADKANVEVYGMPQWADFENIEPEFLTANRVHIPKSNYIDYNRADIKAFQKAFLDAYGTIPNDDAFNGYDVVLFAGTQLKQYGLSFPEKLNKQAYKGLRSEYQFQPVAGGQILDAGVRNFDYQENVFLHILRFDKYGYVPVY